MKNKNKTILKPWGKYVILETDFGQMWKNDVIRFKDDYGRIK